MSASVIRRSSKDLFTLAFEGRRIQWRLSSVGSFIAARCEDQSVTVREASACLETLQSIVVAEVPGIQAPGLAPKFSWHMDGIVANWSFNS